jgi:hypothetical protein
MAVDKILGEAVRRFAAFFDCNGRADKSEEMDIVA